MLVGYHCLECEHEWDESGYGYPQKCPACGTEEFEEQYNLKCDDCGFEFVGAENDECPECESYETHEID